MLGRTENGGKEGRWGIRGGMGLRREMWRRVFVYIFFLKDEAQVSSAIVVRTELQVADLVVR